ncbi:MAG: permease [Bacteroidales bacterium]|jgi:uncharacterized membrane protein YraQ (UPF0718 family)|nr:permease [Bacteroidales bacterium]
MEVKKEIKILFWIIAIFAGVFFLPVSGETFTTAITAALDLAKWYAQEHIVLCLLPAFFIAGAIAVFINQGAILKYFGASAKKWLSYTFATVSGGLLAVCSCTILPLFSSIYKRGAGLGPAAVFLYSGPAFSILSIILTWRILGMEIGVARMIGAIGFSIIIGLAMAFIYRKEEKAKKEEQINFPTMPDKRPMWQTSFHFLTLVLILVFANWGAPSGEGCHGSSEGGNSLWYYIFTYKWHITGMLAIGLCYSLIKILKIKWFWVAVSAVVALVSAILAKSLVANPVFVPLVPMVVAIIALSAMTLFDKQNDDNRLWTISAWGFAKQILPLLAIGVVTAGFLLGSTHGSTSIAGVIPNHWIESAVGGNSLLSNFICSFIGAFMYFATLTEVPIVQGLMASGMGKGPALALLLAGPSLSLPSMLVMRSVMGNQKTIVFVALVVVTSTIAGFLYGTFF